MAHLATYQGKDLYELCDFMGLNVSGTKAEQISRLNGKFTAQMAKIFESWGGFEKKPGDATVSGSLTFAACSAHSISCCMPPASPLRHPHAQKSELEAACIKHGLPKNGNMVDLMLRLAVNKIERGSSQPLAAANQNIPKPAARAPAQKTVRRCAELAARMARCSGVRLSLNGVPMVSLVTSR